MQASKSEIIAHLQRDILTLQGFKLMPLQGTYDLGLGPIRQAFPNECFPIGAIHEFICDAQEDVSSTGGFIAGILSTLMREGAASLWIHSCPVIFPHALTLFGLDPERIIFVDCKKPKEIQWVMEEALKCEGLAAVIGEIAELGFTASRRLQLAVEQSHVTGFIIRKKSKNINTTASVARWQVKSLPSIVHDDMPGIGFPRWNVELLKVRNGKTGSWQVEWKGKRFRHITRLTAINHQQEKKKTG